METVWPRRGDRLFKQGGYRNLGACIISDTSLAAAGYKDAADALVEIPNAQGRNDALVFPIVFCYRQYLELRLKAITESIRDFSGEDFRRTHDLLALWKPIVRHHNEQIGEEDPEAFAAVTACLSEINALDPRASSFRYPEFETMAEIKHQIDLGNLRSVMYRIATFLDALHDQFADV